MIKELENIDQPPTPQKEFRVTPPEVLHRKSNDFHFVPGKVEGGHL